MAHELPLSSGNQLGYLYILEFHEPCSGQKMMLLLTWMDLIIIIGSGRRVGSTESLVIQWRSRSSSSAIQPIMHRIPVLDEIMQCLA
jgi:hypothetical protein